MTKQKQVFRKFCKCIKTKKQKHLIYISIQTLCYETRNWVQVHPVSIDPPWDVSTTWNPPVVNSIDWTWFGTHLSIYGSYSWQCMSEQKPSHEVKGIVRRAPRQDCVEAQIWVRVPKHFCSTEGPRTQWPPSLLNGIRLELPRLFGELAARPNWNKYAPMKF
jgi:hypothetical protein